ncbi:hypothetical protein [Dyadobacter sp. MSC1_007]|uniref:hypothetical protein n=1 Tax=Dyadobacter sp. MSC1_007 TaxID=2909264 RepID=UPI00202FF25D|nr:hypothetical protein [Dyadobacter sp. MSC1_007]
MSYLNGLRLHFAGRFQAAPSTVNNDIMHFNNATFQPNYQEPQKGKNANGWWNPGGGAEWRLLGCTVQKAWLGPDSPVSAPDAVLGCVVADNDRRAPAKIVDLDPLQQLVSEIWGLEVRLCTPEGKLLLRGQYEVAGFMDIWDRAQSGGGDVGAGSMYQSVLTDLEWGDIGSSPFLQALREAASDNLLSIKFNVDGYNMDFKSPEFTRGRVVGSIGPATKNEPQHFTLGRQFIPQDTGKGNFFQPAAGLGFCVARVNETDRRIYLDLGNAIQTTVPGGPSSAQGDLQLVLANGNKPISAPIPYLKPGWYEQTAGVVVIPADRPLSDDELSVIKGNLLGMQFLNNGVSQVTLESPGGVFVRADRFVFRADADSAVTAHLWATKYGAPYPNATIVLEEDPSQLQAQTAPGNPQPALPTGVIGFPSELTADGHGRAELRIEIGDPEQYRGFIDGQVYALRPSLAEIGFPKTGFPLGTWNFISFLVWDKFPYPQPVTWLGSLQPIFQQYANLYPIMSRFLNLADPADVWANRELLYMAFSLPMSNPNTMPVTRDLSTPKRQAILSWLSHSDANGQPLMHLGTAANAPAQPSLTAVSDAVTVPPPQPERGGKAAAASRRLILQQAP